jgi:hypothetical protein
MSGNEPFERKSLLSEREEISQVDAGVTDADA